MESFSFTHTFSKESQQVIWEWYERKKAEGALTLTEIEEVEQSAGYQEWKKSRK